MQCDEGKKFPSASSIMFNSKWHEESKILECSVAKKKVSCLVCYLFQVGTGRNKSEDNYYSGGVADWGKMKIRGKEKLVKLPTHFSSNSYKAV